tara:strand:+ start:28809 stop:29156 length:348 start_codon:yes stop_codon:yes gene_type:complete
MIPPQELMEAIFKQGQILIQKNEEYPKLIEKMADAKMEYNMGFATKQTQLRLDGVAVTIIDKQCRGTSPVAKLERDYIIAEGVVEACRESMRDARAIMDSYRSLLTWMREELVRS